MAGLAELLVWAAAFLVCDLDLLTAGTLLDLPFKAAGAFLAGWVAFFSVYLDALVDLTGDFDLETLTLTADFLIEGLADFLVSVTLTGLLDAFLA